MAISHTSCRLLEGLILALLLSSKLFVSFDRIQETNHQILGLVE